MESTNAANEFIGSPTFTILVISAVILIGLVLRMAFHTHSEYKHRSDD